VLEPTQWVGGQFTSQGVCKPDENKYVDSVGSTAAYRDFHHQCRAHYRNNYKLSPAGANQPLFNAGGSYNAAQPLFAVEPKAADAVLKTMLSNAPTVHLRLGTTVTSAQVSGDAIENLTATGPDNDQNRFIAKMFLDATDLGDLLPLVLNPNEWVVGAEAASDTHEPGAPAEPHPEWIQPITFCIALEHRPGGNYTIPKPAEYDELKAEQKYTLADGAITTMFANDWTTTQWNYRRYIDVRNFADPAFPYDLTTINTGSNDYQKASIPTGSAAQDAAIVARARQAALGYLYWLQTECPRDNEPGQYGYPELRPNPAAFGTDDGVAQYPYIRESRRIRALNRVVMQDIWQQGNPGPRAPKNFVDSCGIGLYAFMDGHQLTGGQDPPLMEGFWINIYPAQIPAGALVPQRLTNLLAACKNLGTTHFTSGLYRLHPIEWNVGESAGALAAFCLTNNVSTRDAVTQQHALRGYQRQLLSAGIPLFWWTDVAFGDPLFGATQLAGVTGMMGGDGNPQMKFNAGDPLGDAGRASLEQQTGVSLPTNIASRGDAAQWLFTQGYT